MYVCVCVCAYLCLYVCVCVGRPLSREPRCASLQGGMKAVLWADTLQCGVMLAGQLTVVIQGALRAGGIQRVWRIAGDGGRLNFWM